MFMRRVRFGAAAASAAALGSRRWLCDSQSSSSSSSSSSELHSHSLPGGRVIVSLPPSYAADLRANRPLDVVYVLDGHSKGLLASVVADAARDDHAAVVGVKGRQWHPSLIVAGIVSTSPDGLARRPDALLEFVTEWAVPCVDAAYKTKPYAAGRAVCGFDASGGAAVRRLLLEDDDRAKRFRFYLVGPDGLSSSDTVPMAASTEAPLPQKTQVYLSGAGGRREAAEAFADALTNRGSSSATDTTMFVNRHGEQTYSRHDASAAAPFVTVDVPDALGTAVEQQPMDAFAIRGMRWLGEQLERQKHASLGSLLPWHEFK